LEKDILELAYEKDSYDAREEYVQRFGEVPEETEDGKLQEKRFREIELKTGKKMASAEFLV
jgi:hypothetical protein